MRALNPDARLIETDWARVEPDAILDTGLFDFEKAHAHPLWAKALYGFADHAPETEDYGVTGFVPRDRWPQNADGRARKRARWDPVVADRRQEIVFVGDRDAVCRERIAAMLDACLAPGERFVPDRWAALPDPLPAWGAGAEAD